MMTSSSKATSADFDRDGHLDIVGDARSDAIQEPGGHHPLVGHHHRSADAQALQLLGEEIDGTEVELDGRQIADGGQ